MGKTKGPRFYTTGISAGRRVAKTIELLNGYPDLIDSVHVRNDDGRVAALAVSIQGVGYVFSPKVEGIRARMEADGVLHQSTTAEPIDVAWAQLYALLELQLEAVASGVAEVEDVLGGYALTSAGHTVGDMIRERRGELMPGEHPLLTAGGAR